MAGRPKAGVTFWDRVLERTIIHETTGCWEFHGCLDGCGYGRINKDGRLVRIHRQSWLEHRGAIAPGLCVCHRCDNPQCWNIEHLFLGTPAENIADMHAKGRHRVLRGIDSPQAKITPELAAQIRLDAGLILIEAARKYGISKSLVSLIRRGEAWQ